ncbi:unnamed protein product [Closterium sp. NIES-65]|nr:unnamed protein product [Closterium sp. NIES-65]
MKGIPASRGSGSTDPSKRDHARTPGVTVPGCDGNAGIAETPASPHPAALHSATSASALSTSAGAGTAPQPTLSAVSSSPSILAAAFSLFPSSPFAEELPSPLSPPDLSPPRSPSVQSPAQEEVELEALAGTTGGNGGGERRASADGGEGERGGAMRREEGNGGLEGDAEAEAGIGEAGGELGGAGVQLGSGEGAAAASGLVYWTGVTTATDPLGSVQCPNSDVEQVRAVASRLLPAIAAATIDQLESSVTLFTSPPSPLEAAEAVKGELLTFLDSRTKGLTAAAVTPPVAVDVTEAWTGVWHGHGGEEEEGGRGGSGGARGGGEVGEGAAEAAASSSRKEASVSGVQQEKQNGEEEKQPFNSPVVTTIQALLDEFVAQRQSLLSRFSSAFRRVEYTEDKVASLAQQLEESDLLDKALRINLAQSLIRRVDAAGTAHCSAQFGTVTGLNSHQERCPFEEVQCANAPCWERVSRYRMGVHDKKCPLKILPCRQGCRLTIARAGMERHCATDCGMKSVPCPYAPMGCTLPLLQKDVAKHCRERVEGHLRAACQLVVEMRQEGQVVARRLDMLEKSISLTERQGKVDVETVRKELQASNKKVTSLEQELRAGSRSILFPCICPRRAMSTSRRRVATHRQNKQRLARRASRDRWNLQQLLIAERRALGPSVAGSYFYQREDAEGKKPLFSFGVMTDVQYADIDDGHSFLGIPRFYRHSLEVVKRAVRDWNHETNHISFAVHFGDLVDGLCPREKSLEAFQTVLGEFGKLANGPVYHMLGNHCLYNLPRKTLNKLLAMPPSADHRSYYHFSPFPGFRLVVLDPYDISMIGWPSGHPHAELAAEILGRQNPNEEKNSPEGMVGMQRRFLKFNGGVSETQLGWLEGVLRESDECGETVIICCHLPVEPNALPTSTCLIWNYDKVLATIQQHDCAVAVISGHAHFGAYTCDDKGIHHRILEAVSGNFWLVVSLP